VLLNGENSSWEGREGRGPGGKEGDAGTDTNIDEGEKEKRTLTSGLGPSAILPNFLTDFKNHFWVQVAV
jgi:hypothetical protein